jgi:hypothetical protein
LIALIAGKDLAARAADAVKDLRRTVQEWSNFYNDFDPLFTWWMGQPYRQTAKALEDYDKFLRDRVSAAVPEAKAPAAAPVNIDAALPPAFAEVPDLTALMAFPQDEMRTVLQQFRGRRGGRGGPGRGKAAPPTKDYYGGWLAALKKLDFNKLSRFGQIDSLPEKHSGRPDPAFRGAAPGGRTAQNRRQRNRRTAHRPRSSDPGPQGGAYSLYARADDRPGHQGIRLVRGGDEESGA